MALQLHPIYCRCTNGPTTTTSSTLSSSPPTSIFFTTRKANMNLRGNASIPTPIKSARTQFTIQSSASSSPAKDTPFSAPSLSDVIWPSAGAFLAMAVLGKLDQFMIPRGLSCTIAPLGAVCAVLFAAPNSPAAKKYNMFVAQIGCAAIGVLALSIFGPGWLARATALASSVAFMIITGTTHPPAASLPIMFIDGAKFHHLNFWYALFPGATGCLLLCLIQEMVIYLKNHHKF